MTMTMPMTMTMTMTVYAQVLLSALVLIMIMNVQLSTVSVTVDATTTSSSSSADPISVSMLHNYRYQSTHESRMHKLGRRLSIHEKHNHRLMKHKKLFHGDTNTNRNINSKANNDNINGNMKGGSCRTRFMFKLPTSQQLHQIMFSNLYKSNSESTTRKSSSILIFTRSNSIANNIRHFNHPFVGITKPILLGEQLQEQHRYQQEQEQQRVISVSLDPHIQQNDIDHDCEWWPQSLDSLAHDVISTNHHVNANANAIANANIDTHNDATTTQRGPWRIKRYTKRIGHGQQCYDRVRDAALDWEFEYFHGDDDNDHDNDNEHRKPDLGILRASPPPSTDPFQNNTNPNILQICNHPSIIQQKKIATFTRFSLPVPPPRFVNILRGLGVGNGDGNGNGNGNGNGIGIGNGNGIIGMPSVYVVNPVAVVYDIVDQLSSKGDRFTSTAYCTLKGHLISGEERVTVILRNDHNNGDNDDGDNDVDNDGKEGNTDYAVVNHGHASSRTRTRTRTHTRINISKQQQQHHANASTCIDSGGYVDVEILSYSKPAPTWMGKLVWPFIAKKQDEFFQRELEALEKVGIGGADAAAAESESET